MQIFGFHRNQVVIQEAEEHDLHGRQLTKFPVFSGQDRVKQLNLYANRIPSLPAAIGAFTRLVNLNLERNGLSKLPKRAGQLHRIDRP